MAADGTVEVYGLAIPKGTPQIAVELLCYRQDRRPEQGGLGKLAHFRNAFRLMWPKYQWSEWVDEIVEAFVLYKWIYIIGHQRASKTYTIAHCMLLDYVAYPGATLSSLATVTFEGLTLRMWGDLMKAAETAEGMDVRQLFRLQSTTNKLRVYPRDARQEAAEKFQIHGIAVTQSKDAEGRIRGGHAERRRIALDEANDIAAPIFEAGINPMSAPDAKFIALSNPVEKETPFGENCEPADGWDSVNENTRKWPLKKFPDGICLHLDGLQSPNVKGNTTRFRGLLTKDNVEEIRRVHGEDSVQWWALVRGWFPPDGMVSKVFPSSVVDGAKPNKVFNWRPAKCAVLDPAFEFDQPVLHLGDLAPIVYGEQRYAINATETIELKFKVGQGTEPKDYQLAHEVMRICKERGVHPSHFTMDRTGNGRGVFAILQKEWSMEIQGVDFSGAATNRMVRSDDNRKAEDLYIYFVSELWFRCAEYCRDGLIGGLGNLHKRTIEDVTSRRYELKQTTKGQRMQVETKKELKKRLGRSPDHGDAFILFGELLCRLGTYAGLAPIMQQLTSTAQWKKQLERAKQASSIYNEDTEFSY